MNQVVTVPQGLDLPAHLRTPDAAAQIAAANAAAGGGIKIGGFPKISIEGGKFHEVDSSVDGGTPRTYMNPALPNQPPTPMMLLEAVIVSANPALIKTYYKDKWVKGSAEAPDCQSSNGVTPDASVAAPQSPVCATCPMNQWGSRISEASGKEIRACSDSKQLVILPGSDLNYKALGLAVTPAALGDWGKYIAALSQRNIPVNSVVTNITFDHTASFPRLQFAFNRFLTADEYALAVKRAEGDDVRLIVSPRSAPAAAPLALAAPAAAPALPAPAPVAAPAPAPAPVVVAPVVVDPFAGQPPHVKAAVDASGGLGTPAGTSVYQALTGMAPPVAAPVAPPPAPVATPAPAAAPVVVTAGFGAAAAPAAAAPAAAPAEPPKRTRRTRAEIDAANGAKAPGQVQAPAGVDLSHLPPAIRAAVEAVGVGSVAGQVMLSQFPAQPAAPVATPAEGDKPQPSGVVSPPVAAAPSGFGASVAAPAPVAAAPVTQPAAGTTGSAESLKDILQRKLGIAPAPAAT